MRARFDIEQKDCNILITGDCGDIPCSQTVKLNILQKNTTKGSSLVESFLTYDNDMAYTLTSDGYYTIYHLVIPTVEWLNLNNDDNHLNRKFGEEIYVASGKTILKYNGESYENVTLEELLECKEKSNFGIEKKDFFSLCIIEQCLQSKIQELLEIENNCSYTSDTPKEELKYRRDMINMFLNMIRYYADCGKYWEAQRLLEKLNNCYQFCSEEDNTQCECND